MKHSLRVRLRSFYVRFKGPLWICCVVLLANFLYVTGIFSPDPLNRQSGLLTDSTRLVGGLETIDPNAGTNTQALGHGAATQLAHGQLPWWNYSEQVGAPLAGGMQSAALFPLTLLLGFSGGLLYFHIILQAVAGIATYYLLKRLSCKETAATVGGMLFAVNGTFAWLTNAIFNPIAFLPLLLLGVEIAFARATSKQARGWFVIALAFALSCYAGFPEVAYLDGLLVAGWTIVRAIQIRKGAWFAFLIKVASGLGVGLLLAAPILVAFFDYLQQAYLGLHDGSASHMALPLAGLPALIFPYMYGPIFAAMRFDATGALTAWWSSVGGYLTLSLLCMAVVGLVGKSNRYLKLFLLAWIVVVVARVYGLPGLSYVFNLLPGMGQAAVYRYLQPTFELATVILAALGLDYLLGRTRLSIRHTRWVAGAIAAIAVTAVVLAAWAHAYSAHAPFYWVPIAGSVLWGLATVAALVVVYKMTTPYKKYVYSAILVADALLMFIIPQLSAFRTVTINTGPVTFLQSHLDDGRFYTLGPIQPNYGTYYNIASINTNNLPLPKTWATYITSNLDPLVDPVVFNGAHAPGIPVTALDMLWKNLDNYRYVGVKYVVTGPNQIPADQAQAHQVAEVYRDKTASIYTLPNPKSYFEITSGDCAAKFVDKATAQVTCKQPSALLRRELYMPGWSATLDNKDLTVKQEGPLFQSVQLPTGTHTVRFSFVPPYEQFAGVLLLAGCGVIAICYWKRPK